MGSNSVLAVLGFIIIAAVIMGVINRRNNQAYENTYGYQKHITARDITRNSIQIALREIDTLSTVTASAFPVTGSMDGGTYTVNGTIINDTTLRLTASGKFNDSVYNITATLLRRTQIVPTDAFKGALAIHPDSVGYTAGSNGGLIDGYDHDTNGVKLPTSPDSVASVDVWTGTDSANVKNGVKSANNKGDTTRMNGAPQILVDPTMIDPNTYGDSYKSVADSIIKGAVDNKGVPTTLAIGGGPYGTPSHPEVVFLDGTPSSSTSLFNFQTSGWGTLVVKGSLKMTSNASWHGLIIVYGAGVISLTAGGSGNNNASTIVGGVVMGGFNGSSFSLNGNATILFSKSTLVKIKAHTEVTAKIYQIVDWYE